VELLLQLPHCLESSSSVTSSASTRVHGSLPSHQDSDPSCRLYCSTLGKSIPTLQDWRKSQLHKDATTTRYSHLRKQRIVVVTYVTFFPTSRLDRQHGYVLTIISISVFCAATRRGTGVRELPSWRLPVFLLHDRITCLAVSISRDPGRHARWGKSLTPAVRLSETFDPAGTRTAGRMARSLSFVWSATTRCPCPILEWCGGA
jgi:hypothetical protein